MNYARLRDVWVGWVLLGGSLSACSGSSTVTPDVVTVTDVDVADTPGPVDVVASRDTSPATDTLPTTDVPAATDSPGVIDTSTLDRPLDVDGSDTGPVSACGSSAPSSGSPCGREGLVCQYGDDPRESCRTQATCTGGRWAVIAPRCTPITPPAMCPSTREAAAGMACGAMNAVCNYGGLTCTCTNCRSFPVGGCGGPLQWRCVAPNMAPGCPALQPNLGANCPMDGQRCGYDCEAYGIQGGRVCEGGVWRALSNLCPISSRATKRDIRYLTAAESASLAEETLRTRLATYEYTDPALRGPRRLGFIYEDATTHPFARNPDISGVDLYGYTSMLLATVQRQQQQIEALERAVRSLRARPPTRDTDGRRDGRSRRSRP